MSFHSVEKIGGTSMSNYAAVRDNIILGPGEKPVRYNRVFVVSAYGGVTNKLLEHKKTGQPGVYELFSRGVSDQGWQDALAALKQELCGINAELFREPVPCGKPMNLSPNA